MAYPNDFATLPIPLQRYIPVASGELLAAVLDELPQDQHQKFSRMMRYLEHSTRLDFIDARRLVLENFEMFSAAAQGRHRFLRLQKAELTDDEVDTMEFTFLSEFVELMHAAHYEMLTPKLWEIALSESFTFSLPVEVEWENIDSEMLAKFWKKRGRREDAADVMDKALIFTRGLDVARAKGLFITEKIELLLGDLKAWTLACFAQRPEQAQEEKEPMCGPRQCEILANGNHDSGDRGGQTWLGDSAPMLAKVVERKTLRRYFPTAKSLLLGMAKTVELVEPRFKEVVILYRNKADPQREDTRPTVTSQVHAAGRSAGRDAAKPRNIHVKRFEDIPVGDVEMVMPDKAIGVSNTKIFTLVGMLLAAVVAGIWGLFAARADGTAGVSEVSAVLSVVGLICMRAIIVYMKIATERASVADRMNHQLYEKSLDAQEGLLLSVLEDVISQILKRATLAYFCLIQHSVPIEVESLDRLVENFLLRAFGCKMDFAVDLSLKKLQMEHLVTCHGGVVDACDLDTALLNLCEREDLRMQHQKSSNEELLLETLSRASSFTLSTASPGRSETITLDESSPSARLRAGSKLMRALRGSFRMPRRPGASMTSAPFESIMESETTRTNTIGGTGLPPAWSLGKATTASAYSVSNKALSVSSSDGIKGTASVSSTQFSTDDNYVVEGGGEPLPKTRRALFKRVFNSPFS